MKVPSGDLNRTQNGFGRLHLFNRAVTGKQASTGLAPNLCNG
jgi:hypothetical protein